MATGEVRRVSREDIQLVQNLIERCLQLYMSQKEVVKFLLQQAKIEPGFTELVWQKLEEENQEFFRAYHLRLIVKEQILRFNELLERQDQLMHQIYSSEYASMHMSDGSQIPSMEENTLPHSLEHADAPIKAETVSEEFNTPMHSAYMSAPSLQQCSPAIALTNRTGRLEAPSDVPFSQNSNVRMVEGLNGGMLKPGDVYVGNNAVVFSTDGNALRAHSTIGDAHVSSYNNVVSNAQPLNQGFSDPETRAFRSLGQIPRNFSLSDLTADFTCSSEILESYPGPIYVEPDHDFLDPHGIREHQGHIGPP